MPQAAIVAGIQGAAALGGGILANRGQSNALNAQRAASREAMILQRQQMAAANSRYEREYAAYQQRQQQRNDLLRGVLGRYGISFGEPAAPAGGAPAPSVAPQGAAGSPGGLGAPGGMGGSPLAPSIAAPAAPGASLMPQRRGPSGVRVGGGLTLADLMGMGG